MIKLVNIEFDDLRDAGFNSHKVRIKNYLFEDDYSGDQIALGDGYWDYWEYVTYNIDLPFAELAQRIEDAKIKTFSELKEKFPYNFL